MTTVLSYGGGRQTVAICVLIARGVLPKPDRIVMADTGRENPMTLTYLAAHVRPMLAPLGLAVEIIPPRVESPDIYSKNGDILIPAFTSKGKLPAFCSGHWKRDRINPYLNETKELNPVSRLLDELANVTLGSKKNKRGEKWIGFALDEKPRVTRMAKSNRDPSWEYRFPLVELLLMSADCLALIRSHGLPEPHRSSCWMCPHKGNAEWRVIRDEHPSEWQQACELDDEIRASDTQGGVWLHKSRVPLREADLEEPETPEIMRQCGLGTCFI